MLSPPFYYAKLHVPTGQSWVRRATEQDELTLLRNLNLCQQPNVWHFWHVPPEYIPKACGVSLAHFLDERDYPILPRRKR